MTRPIPQQFDNALLKQSDEERLAYFNKKIVAHTNLSDASNLAKDNIEFAPQGEVVAIVGPSAVGTTVLGRSLWRYYQSNWPIPQATGPAASMVHSIGISAPSSAGRVDERYWKRLLKLLLTNGGDILIDKKLYVPPTEFQLQHSIPSALLGTLDTDRLQSATLAMLRARATNVVLINQAERLFPEHDKAGCLRSQQMLRDLAAESQTRFVLVANYRILKTACVGGNFVQRSHIVHMRRYDHLDAEEWNDFNSTLDELLGNIPSSLRLKRISENGAKKLYVNSVGCIGTLKKTLTMGVSHAFRTKEEITEELLLRFGQPNVTAAQLATEALQGERMLMDADTKDVERILDRTWAPDEDTDSLAKVGQRASAKGASLRQQNPVVRRIGERKPTRDPVGGSPNARRA